MHLATLIGIALAASVPATAVGGTIYKCSGPNGETIFRQVPCGEEFAETAAAASRLRTVPSAERIADEAAISKINGECAWRAWNINDRADVDIRGTDTTRLRSEVASAANESDGPPSTDGIVGQLAAAEDRRAATLSVQRIDLKHLRKECDKERAVERKRQADRDAARMGPNP